MSETHFTITNEGFLRLLKKQTCRRRTAKQATNRGGVSGATQQPIPMELVVGDGSCHDRESENECPDSLRRHTAGAGVSGSKRQIVVACQAIAA